MILKGKIFQLKHIGQYLILVEMQIKIRYHFLLINFQKFFYFKGKEQLESLSLITDRV